MICGGARPALTVRRAVSMRLALAAPAGEHPTDHSQPCGGALTANRFREPITRTRAAVTAGTRDSVR